NKLGVDNALAFRIYGKYEETTLEVIQENPYQLIQEVDGIGFNRADTIADYLNVQPDADERIQAGILYALYTISNDSGDTYAMKRYLGERTTQILERSRPFIIDEELIEYNLKRLIEESTIYEDEGRYFLSSLYHAEWGIVNSLERRSEEHTSELQSRYDI